MTDIVVFGEDFGGLPSSTQHLIKHLANNHRILWVNSIGLRQPKFTPKDAKRLVTKLTGSVKQQDKVQTPFGREEDSNIHTITLLTIPAPKSKWARSVATKMMKHQLSKKLNELGFQHAVFWTSLPTAVDICREMSTRGIVYYCGDDFGALAGVDHQTVLEHEADLIDNADLILTASDKLAAEFPKEKTVTLPHGVDFNLFSEPAAKAQDMPNNGRKVLGFYGSLSEWLDYRLIEQVADQAQDWDLVFIGPNEFPHNPLPQRSNVHYLGPRAHQDYLATHSIGMRAGYHSSITRKFKPVIHLNCWNTSQRVHQSSVRLSQHLSLTNTCCMLWRTWMMFVQASITYSHHQKDHSRSSNNKVGNQEHVKLSN